MPQPGAGINALNMRCAWCAFISVGASDILAAMHPRRWVFPIVGALSGLVSCFQSDFVLYGPLCQKGESEACRRGLGDKSEERVCFRPDPASDVGYCALSCISACENPGGSELRCIDRGDVARVCALDCADDVDCPEEMRCEDDPTGLESFKLCVPRP